MGGERCRLFIVRKHCESEKSDCGENKIHRGLISPNLETIQEKEKNGTQNRIDKVTDTEEDNWKKYGREQNIITARRRRIDCK